MIANLLARLVRLVVRRVGVRTLAVWGLLIALTACVIAGLASILRDLDPSLLISVSFAGLAAGWLLAGPRFTPRRAATLAFVLGLGLALVQVGQMHGQVFALLQAANRTALQVLGWRPFLPSPDPFPALSELAGLGRDSLVILQRLGGWLLGLIRSRPAFDPIATALLWSLALWGVSFWSAWAIRRDYTPLAAVFPAGLLLSASLSAARASIAALLAMLGLTLLFMGWWNYTRREWVWERDGVDFSEDVRVEVGMAVVMVVGALTFAAALSPAFSLQRLFEFARRFSPANQEQVEAVSESLGLERQPEPVSRPLPGSPGGAGGREAGFETAEQTSGGLLAERSGGLPRRHLLGSGPELSEEVVMLVYTGELPPLPAQLGPDLVVPRYYWRSITYDLYNGRGWLTGPTDLRRYPPQGTTLEGIPEAVKVMTQEVHPVADLGGIVYAAGEIQQVDSSYTVLWRHRPGGQDWIEMDVFGAAITTTVYTARSIYTSPGAAELREAGASYPDWVLNRYLRLPEATPDRLRRLANELTAAELTPYDRAKAIEAYLRSFPYSLEIPASPEGRDVADYFLFDLKTGYCDYYATAMVVLARAAGLPARLAIGYASGHYDPVNARYVVTAADAHSWPEIFFPGFGWVAFEPTAALPTIRPSGTPQLPVVTGSEDDRLLNLPDPAFIRQLLVGILAAAGLALAVSLLWSASEPWRFAWLSPPSALRLIYRRLVRSGRRLGAPLHKGDTPAEFAASFAARLEQFAAGPRWRRNLEPAAQEVRRLTRLYAASLYAPHPPSPADRRTALHLWGRLRWRLWLFSLLRRRG